MILRRGWIPAALALLMALLGLFFAMTRSPGYEGSTRVRLDLSRPADYGQTQAAKELLASAVEDIKTHSMADATAARLGPDFFDAQGIPPDYLHTMLYSGDLRVGADRDVFELDIKARHPDPAVAEAVSRQWAETFVDRREKANLERQRDDRVAAVIRDDTSHTQYAPRKKLLVGVAGLLGLLFGGLIVLLLEYFESAVVRNARDAERLTGLPIIAALPPTAADRRGPGATRRGLADLAASGLRLLIFGWPILVLALLGAGTAFAVSSAQPTLYRARARIALEPANLSNWGNAQAIRETMRGYKEDIKTFRMARLVDEKLQLDIPPAELLDGKRLNVAEDVGIFEIRLDVFDRDAEQAKRISRAWADAFIEAHRIDDLQRDQRDRILASLRDEVIDAPPWSPRRGVNTLAGAIIGALVGGFALWFRQVLLGGLIRRPEEAERAAGAALLAVIPPAER
jgi:capsular polysaccharide biosynthesis protein